MLGCDKCKFHGDDLYCNNCAGGDGFIPKFDEKKKSPMKEIEDSFQNIIANLKNGKFTEREITFIRDLSAEIARISDKMVKKG